VHFETIQSSQLDERCNESLTKGHQVLSTGGFFSLWSAPEIHRYVQVVLLRAYIFSSDDQIRFEFN